MLVAVELIAFTALFVACRAANYREVFFGGEIYFADADCYARMTRARICFQHPGTVIRHHKFENFPVGTTPHTTAPFDYAIVGLATVLRLFTARALELSGALVSPLLGLLGGWFLWWWLRAMRFRFRAVALFLFAASPILVHATALGRPDHQSLELVLVLLALCAEWTLHGERSARWEITSASAWGLALWVSLYEPLGILAIVLLFRALPKRRGALGFAPAKWWLVFGSFMLVAFAIEQRALWFFPSVENARLAANWLSSIGEMRPLFSNPHLWFEWTGYFLPLAAMLLGFGFLRRRLPPIFIVAVLAITFVAMLWQARWGYFATVTLCLLLPALLSSSERYSFLIWVAVVLATFPILRAWDESLWPNESIATQRAERAREQVDLRAASTALSGVEAESFLAPWWLSPAVAYWSGKDGVAGSSHEAIDGILDSARFFAGADPVAAREILLRRRVGWVIAYDAERTLANSRAILGVPATSPALATILDRTPSQAPDFRPVYANGTAKVFRVGISH